jgi:hypothetical protein
MRFDLPLTAFALESSGAAAGALGAAHTLTLPAQLRDQAPLELLGRLALAGTVNEGESHQVRVPASAPPSLTLTF